MSRITRHAMYMGMARNASLRSTCHRLNVGAVVVTQDNRILGLGYNGSPPGEEHCTAVSLISQRPTKCVWYSEAVGCQVIHAEVNALDRVVDSSLIVGALIYVTHSPCRKCAERMVHAGIKHVYYETEYRDKEPLGYLEYHGLDVQRVLPSGYIIDYKTGQVSLD